MTNKEKVIAIDLGGTNLRVALVNRAGNILARAQAPTNGAKNTEDIADEIVRLSVQILRQVFVSKSDVLAIGIGAPGIVDQEKGVIFESPNLLMLNNAPLGQLVSQKMELRVILENDANAAALGEYWLGAGQGASSLIMLTLGTGVGGGIVLNGKIWRGASGNAGEIGHISVNPHGEKCNCGSCGCLELYASATGMVRAAQNALIFSKTDSRIAKLCGGDSNAITAELISQAAAAGDNLALKIFNDAARALGIAVGGLINLLNPEIITIGGGVVKAGNLIFTPLIAEVKRRSFKRPFKACRVIPAELGNDAGILGAAKNAFNLCEPE